MIDAFKMEQEALKIARSIEKGKRKDYVKHTKKISHMIFQCGLNQTLKFFKAKEKDYEELEEHLNRLLKNPPKDSPFAYMEATKAYLDGLHYLGRFTEALSKEGE